MAVCAQCGKHEGTYRSPAGRLLCASCHRGLATLGGAGAALVSGASAPEAVGAGIAAGGFAGAVARDLERTIALNQRIAQTRGFWRRLWLRVVG